MVLGWETLSRGAGKGETSGGGSTGPYRLLPTISHGSKCSTDSIPCEHIPVKWELYGPCFTRGKLRPSRDQRPKKSLSHFLPPCQWDSGRIQGFFGLQSPWTLPAPMEDT